MKSYFTVKVAPSPPHAEDGGNTLQKEGNHKYTGCLDDRYVKIKIKISKCVHSTEFQFATLERKLSNCFLLPTLKRF